jgi:hypothetical protein
MVFSACPLFSSARSGRQGTAAMLMVGPAYQPSRPCLHIVDGAVQSFTSTLDETGRMDNGLNAQSSLCLGQLGLPAGRTPSDAERMLCSSVVEIVAETARVANALGCQPVDQDETVLRRAFQRAQTDGCTQLARIESNSSGSTDTDGVNVWAGLTGEYRCSVYLVRVTRPKGQRDGIFRRIRPRRRY